MDYPKHQINFMPESYIGYCSTACFMGVLNYFRYTQFNMKDTWDVMKIAKLGRYKFGEGLFEIEMGYALYKLGFKITYFTGYSEKELSAYIKNPVMFIENNINEKYKKYIKNGKWIEGDGIEFADLSDTTILQTVLKENNIKKYYKKDIVEEISKNQDENTLFILGLNSYILFDIEEAEGESGGHVVLCKGINNGKFEIYDPGPFKNPVFIESGKVIKAMNDAGPYTFVMVKNEN